MFNVVDLVVRGATHLADTLGDAVHAVDVGLTEQSAVRVDRQFPAEREPFDRREVLRLAAPTEAELLQLGEDERCEVVVEERGLDIGRFETRVAPELFGDHAHLRQTGDVVAVVARHHLALGGRALHRSGDHGRRLAKVACPLGAGDDQCDAAVTLLAAVEQAQHRLDDPS